MNNAMIKLFLISIFTLALPAFSLEKEPFDPNRFTSLQSEGKVVLVDVFATWCPTCAKQQALFTQFESAHPDADVYILVVDFDKQKEWVTHFKAPRQSTLILYTGEQRQWFSVAETRYDVLEKALLDAISASETL